MLSGQDADYATYRQLWCDRRRLTAGGHLFFRRCCNTLSLFVFTFVLLLLFFLLMFGLFFLLFSMFLLESIYKLMDQCLFTPK